VHTHCDVFMRESLNLGSCELYRFRSHIWRQSNCMTMISQYVISSVNISFATILLTSDPLPSVSQGTWRSYLRVIYVGGSCKDQIGGHCWLTKTTLSFGFFFIYWWQFNLGLQQLEYSNTLLGVSTALLLTVVTSLFFNQIFYLKFSQTDRPPTLHTCNSNSPNEVSLPVASSPSFQLNTPYVQSDSTGCNSNLEKPHRLN